MSQVIRSANTFILRDAITVHAPIDRCFLLSTNVDIVHRELGMTAKPGGRLHGLAEEGDLVRWEGWQLGMLHHHVSQIAEYQRPYVFQDKMVDGAFKSFEHDHHLREVGGGTVMEDELRFSLSYGGLGRLVARLIVAPHILRLMRQRFELLKKIAESDKWKKYVGA